MTPKEAYQYFVVRAQDIAISKNWSPVNWYVFKSVFSLTKMPEVFRTSVSYHTKVICKSLKGM